MSFTAVRLWFLQNGLQLNADKSEVVFLGTHAQLRSAANITTINVAGSTLPVASKLNVAQTVACSIVASRLDYCNALLTVEWRTGGDF